MAIRNNKDINLEDIYDIMKDQISFMKNTKDDTVKSNARVENTFKNSIKELVKQNVKNDTGGLTKAQNLQLKNINEELDNIYDMLRDQMYYMKDSADDNKKIVNTLDKSIKDIVNKVSTSGTSSSNDSTQGTEKKGLFNTVTAGLAGFIGGMFTKLKSFPFKSFLKKAGIIGAVYFLGKWIVDGINDYKKYLGISPDDDLSLRQKIVGVTSGLINGFSNLVEQLTGIKLFDEKEVIEFIDRTTKEINNGIKELKEKFPKIGNAFDYMLDGFDEFLNITGDFLRDLFSPSKIDYIKRNIKAQKRLDELKSRKETDLTEDESQEIKDLESEIKNNKQDIKNENRKTHDKKIKELKTKLKELKELKQEEEEGSWLAAGKRRFLYGDQTSFNALIKKTEFQLKQEQKKTGETYEPNYNKNEETSAMFNPSNRSVTYSSGEVKQGGHRNWRNNNPGNIEYGNFAKAHGAIGSDGRFAIFPSMEAGYKAQADLLQSKNYRNKTLTGAINRYAPRDENDTQAYINAVSGATGIDPNTPISSLSSEEMNRVVKAMSKHEGMKAGTTYTASGQVIQPSISPTSTPTVREDAYASTESSSVSPPNITMKSTPTSISNTGRNSIATYQMCEDEEIMLALLRSTGLNKVV